MLATLTMAVMGCGPESPDWDPGLAIGGFGQACYANRTCDAGLVCSDSGSCVSAPPIGDPAFGSGDRGQPCRADRSCNVGLSCQLSGLCESAHVTTPTSTCGCTNGSTRCNGNALERCTNGAWVPSESCGFLQCSSEGCVDAVSTCDDGSSIRLGSVATNIVYREAPTPTMDCVPAAGFARTTRYAPTVHEERDIDVVWNIAPFVGDCSAFIRLDPMQLLVTQLNQLVSGRRSSRDNSMAGIQEVPAGKTFQAYRQTSRIEHTMVLFVDDAFAGTVTVTDWRFAVEFAGGDTCPVPSTAFPPAGPVSDSCAQ